MTFLLRWYLFTVVPRIARLIRSRLTLAMGHIAQRKNPLKRIKPSLMRSNGPRNSPLSDASLWPAAIFAPSPRLARVRKRCTRPFRGFWRSFWSCQTADPRVTKRRSVSETLTDLRYASFAHWGHRFVIAVAIKKTLAMRIRRSTVRSLSEAPLYANYRYRYR